MIQPIEAAYGESGEGIPAGPVIGPRLSAAGGVEITGIDLAEPLTPGLRVLILAAFHDHHVVVFPGQALTREQQYAFATNFGEVESSGQPGSKRREVAHVISNLDKDGNPVDRSSSPVSNYRWHTDKSWHAVPPSLTMLFGVEVPPKGGDTEFANTMLSYAELPEATKRRIAALRVVFRWGAGGGKEIAAMRNDPPVDHPLVRTHPETGHKALYLGNHASHILGMPEADGARLLDELLQHATQRQFVYAHKWRNGDLAMWDNRCLLHRAAANYDTGRDRRILHRSVVAGTVPF
jgi:alpha-ketoglutarate-dependent taurine dioxygenase